MTRPERFSLVMTFVLAFLFGVSGGTEPSRLTIDASDLDRKLLRATQVVSIPDGPLVPAGGEFTLWYPKWVQGSHAPGGPVQNLAGIEFSDLSGKSLDWHRAPGDVHRFIVSLPPGTDAIQVRLRYICNQSSANSHGLDSFGAESLGVISPNTVLMYPEGVSIDSWPVICEIQPPEGWRIATALPRQEGVDPQHPTLIVFQAVPLVELIDSPVMLGRYVATYDLVESGVEAPPHRLHLFSEIEGQTRLPEEVLARFRQLVTQASRLFGDHPFPSFDFLVATTNQLDRNGLEHQRSTLNIIPLDRLDAPDHLKGWDRMLIPHEYVHAWCGKFRRPAGMIHPDAHTPNDTELLWVYEGLTQHLGEILEVRSGMASPDEYRWMLLERLRWARLQQGREWRSLADTGAASHTLRSGSESWGHLRRDQDYYQEGAVFWLECDALIRERTGGTKSLDDFCRSFFHSESRTPSPRGYTRADVVGALEGAATSDWDSFVRTRIETPTALGPLHAATQLGYLVQYDHTSAEGPDHARIDTLDARDSIGVSLSSAGVVTTVQLGSPADGIKLAPGTRILGIDDHLWSRQRFEEALARTPVTGRLDLLLALGDRIERRSLVYDGGPRFFRLERDTSRPDGLAPILKPR